MVDRYREFLGLYEPGGVVWDKNGDYVKHDDYAALLAERDALAKVNALLTLDCKTQIDHLAMQHRWFAKISRERDALAAQVEAMKGKRPPCAWLHTMVDEMGDPRQKLTFFSDNPWGVPGRDYSEQYTVTAQPLVIVDAARQETKP